MPGAESSLHGLHLDKYRPLLYLCRSAAKKSPIRQSRWKMNSFKNSSGIPDQTVRGVISFIESELGIQRFDVDIRSCAQVVKGRACPSRVELAIGVDPESVTNWLEATAEGKRWRGWARKPGNLRRLCHWPAVATGGHRRVRLLNRIEALVYIAAHELRHVWRLLADVSDIRAWFVLCWPLP